MNKENTKNIYLILLVISVCLLLLSNFIFFRKVSGFKKNGHYPRHGSAGNLDLNRIQGWMTFDFINRAFSLPSDYLKNSLKIYNTTYPKLTLTNASISKNINQVDFINQVKEDIKLYLDHTKSNPR